MGAVLKGSIGGPAIGTKKSGRYMAFVYSFILLFGSDFGASTSAITRVES
jgi:hypothetical protein